MMIHVLWSLPNTAFLDLEKIAVKMALNLAGSCEYSSPLPMVNNGPTSAQRIHLHLHMMKSKKKQALTVTHWPICPDHWFLSFFFRWRTGRSGRNPNALWSAWRQVPAIKRQRSNQKQKRVVVSRVICYVAPGCSRDITPDFREKTLKAMSPLKKGDRNKKSLLKNPSQEGSTIKPMAGCASCNAKWWYMSSEVFPTQHF